jgi:hypothetical protein
VADPHEGWGADVIALIAADLTRDLAPCGGILWPATVA